MVWPEYIGLKDWAACLVIDYPNEYLPLLENEDKWQEWGAAVVNTGIFAKANVPSPFSIKEGQKKENFTDWREWAKTLYIILTNEQNLNTN